jgi:hypothetical protein
MLILGFKKWIAGNDSLGFSNTIAGTPSIDFKK